MKKLEEINKYECTYIYGGRRNETIAWFVKQVCTLVGKFSKHLYIGGKNIGKMGVEGQHLLLFK